MNLKDLLRIATVVALGVAVVSCNAANYSNYGRLNPTPDGMIDLATNQKVLMETDYESAYKGLAVQRWKHLNTGKWRWKFDSMIGYLPDDSRPGITQTAEDFLALQLPERQLILFESAAKNRANGVFETFRKGTPNASGGFVIEVTNPANDTVTVYSPYKSVFVADDGGVYIGDVPDIYKKRYFYYRIVSERLRDGTVIRYDWNSNADCSDVTVVHAPSNAGYIVKRSSFAYIDPKVTTHPRAGWDYCKVDSITLPNSMNIVYSYGSRVPTDWAPGEAAYARLNKVTLTPPGTTPPTVLRRYEHRSDIFERTDPTRYMAVTKISNADGRAVQHFTFDAEGRPNTSSTGGKNPIWVTYNADGSRTVTDDDGIARTFYFQKIAGVRRLTGISSPCQWCSLPHNTMEYDAATGLVSKTTDFAGVATTYARWDTDPRRRLKRVVEAAGTADARATDSEWHPTFNLPIKVTVTQGKHSYTKAYQYDGLGRETIRRFDQTINGKTISRTTKTTYVNHPGSAIAKSITITEPQDDVAAESVSTYDVAGRLRSQTNALGHVTSYSDFDAHGRPRSITYPTGLIATIRYDWRGKVLSRNYDGVTTTNEYSDAGLLLKSVATLADMTVVSSATYTYDAGGRVTSVSDVAGNRVETDYDKMGRVTGQYVRDYINLLSEGYEFGYADSGRTITSRPALDSIFTETKLNNRYLVKSVSEPFRASATTVRRSSMTYDNFGRLAEKVTSSGVHQTLDYDAADRPVQSTYWPTAATPLDDPSRRDFLYASDAEGNPLSSATPDGGTESYTLTAAGGLRSSSNSTRGPNWKFAYDALRRATRRSIIDPAGHELGYISARYDTLPGDTGASSAPGQLTGLSGSFGDIDYSYSKAGRITMRQTRKPGGTSADTHTHLYYYDGAGRMASTRYPSGRWIWVARDNLGRPTELSTAATQTGPGNYVAKGISYYAGSDEVVKLSLGGNQPTEYKRDSMRRLTGYSFAGLDYALSYEIDGKLKSVDKTFPKDVYITCPTDPHYPRPCTPHWGTTRVTERQQEYVYDTVSRQLTSAVTSGTRRNYAHDAYGNLLSGPLRTFATNAKSNQVTGFQYNFGGRVIYDGVNVIGYDMRGYIERISNSTSGTTTYTYNAEGQRASKSNNGYTIYYHYDANGTLIGERDASGVWLREYIWLGARPLMMIIPAKGATAEARYAIHVDHSGAPTAMTSEDGTVVWTWERGPYGEGAPVTTIPGLTLNVRMPGQYFDAESGYFYNNARYYDPRSGRFLQPDPAGEAGSGPSLYSYTRGDPVNYVDPSGQSALWASFVGGAAGAATGGMVGWTSSGGDPRAVGVGAVAGWTVGFFNPIGSLEWAFLQRQVMPGVTYAQMGNAAMATLLAQNLADLGQMDGYKAVSTLVGHAVGFGLGGTPANLFARSLFRGGTAGTTQLGYNLNLGYRPDAIPDPATYRDGNPSFNNFPFRDWGREARLSGTGFVSSFMGPQTFYSGIYDNPANIVGWPSDDSSSAEEKLATDILIVITPDDCNFCN